MLDDGGCAPIPLHHFSVRTIESFVGNAFSIISVSNMVTFPKQQIEKNAPDKLIRAFTDV